MNSLFHAGDLAQIKTTGEVVTISKLKPGLTEMYYLVYRNEKSSRIKESDLVPYSDTESEILEKIENNQFDNADSFQKYAYYRLFSESQDGNLYSYQGNKIIFNPFQYKPLMKFLSVDSDERLLIADEVGVGKTIESGIILDELIARGELAANASILIICPSILCQKWRNELRTKFNLDDFHIHDGKSLKYMLRELAETERIVYPHSIVSEQLFRGEKYQLLLKECMEIIGEPFFKMLIVDECHHYRNPQTNTHGFGKMLSLCSERVLMLSATPFNLRSSDLYYQLNILNPSLYPDEEVFNQLLKQIRIVNKASDCVKKDDNESRLKLEKYADELKAIADNNQFISENYDRLYWKIKEGEKLTVKEKVDFEKTVQMLNPIATSFTRTLKKDAIEHRVTRETMTLEVNFTSEEEDVYRSFLDTNLQKYKILGISERAFGLILNGLERIAASSIVALESNISKFISMDDEEFAESFSEEIFLDMQTVKVLKQYLNESYVELLQKIKGLNGVDSKYDTFKQLIENVQNASGANKRIIVFSFYTETLKYLRRKLASEGYKVALMYGQTPYETSGNSFDDDGFRIYGRNDIMHDFENGEYEILLVSEVGGEGLDFQFCASLINYDLPYNPMRIEQRIGRIDRMGQEADKIIIGNLCIKDTIDEVINTVLLSRISEAEDLVGELEPIIVQQLAKINELIITRDFTEDEILIREKEIEQRIEKAKQTREEFEESRYELVNDKGFREEFAENVKNSRISPRESLLFTYSFLKKENGCWCKLLSDSAAFIHLSKDMCDRLKAYKRKLNLGKSGEEITSLIDNNGELEIDFDGDSAYANKERKFFKPSGAWIHFIIDYIRAMQAENMDNVFYVQLKRGIIDNLSTGRYWLFIYEMEFKGFFDSRSYEYVLVNESNSKVICLDEDQKKKLYYEVKNAKVPENINYELYDDMHMLADDRADERKEEISREATTKNNVKIGSRIQALKNLSSIRIRNLEDELIASHGKDEDRISRAIQRESKKLSDRITILEEKMKFVGTCSLDAVGILDIS